MWMTQWKRSVKKQVNEVKKKSKNIDTSTGNCTLHFIPLVWMVVF